MVHVDRNGTAHFLVDLIDEEDNVVTADDLVKIFGTGAVAAILTVGASWLRESLASKKLATYSALRAAVTLETFALGCSALLAGDNIARVMKGKKDLDPGELAFPPFPTFPDDIDWKLLDPELTAETLTLKNDVEISAAQFIRMTKQVLDDDNAHLSTIKKMAESALSALKLAERLRKGLPPLPNVNWEKLVLHEHLESVAKEHIRRAEAQMRELKAKQAASQP
jgi:hypothetical protein